jgi:type I restriction enzyme S subunit
MRMVKLGDYIKLIGGGTPSKKVDAYWNGSIPWASVKDLKSDYLTQTVDTITQEGLSKSTSRLIPANSLVISTRMAVGKAVITEIDTAINQDLKAVIPTSELDQKFLFYLFKAKVQYFESVSTGATVKGIKIQHLNDLTFPLPPLPTQTRIARALDLADRHRRLLREELDAYDELGESLFLEMFGDVTFNKNNYPKFPLNQLALNNGIKCGPFGTQLAKSEFTKKGIPVWGIPQVNSKFKKPPHDFITEQKAIQLDQYSVLPSDIVMSRKGNVGKCAIYPLNWEKGILHSDVLRIRCNPDVADSIFLSYQFRMNRDLETQIKNISHGAIMAGINVTKLKGLIAVLPPLPLQQTFAKRIKQINLLKAQAQTTLKEADDLFNALLQRAFRGELFPEATAAG